MDYNVDVAYTDRIYETIFIDADNTDDAEYTVLNMVRDQNPTAHNVEVLQVRNG